MAILALSLVTAPAPYLALPCGRFTDKLIVIASIAENL
jgi:hypothetical protein